MSASAFSLTLTVPKTGFEVVSGEPVKGGLQREVPHFHCPHCKSWVFTRPGDQFPFVNLRATMLDDASWFQPYIETYTDEKLKWASTGAARSFRTQPDYNEYEALIGEYQARGARPSSTSG
jgi:hypothetical protein